MIAPVVEFAAHVAEDVVLLVAAVAGVHDVVSLGHLVHKLEHLVSGRLAVIVEAYHDVAMHLGESCHDGGVLAKVPRQIDGHDARRLLCQGSDGACCSAVIGRAVVHEYDFEIIVGAQRSRPLDFFDNRTDGCRRAVTGYNAGNQGVSHGVSRTVLGRRKSF